MDNNNENQNNDIARSITMRLAAIAALLVKMLGYMIFYCGPLVLGLSFYFYIKSVLFAEVNPEAGIIDNRFFIIFTFMFMLLILSLLFVIDDNMGRMFTNMKNFVFDKNGNDVTVTDNNREIDENQRKTRRFSLNALKIDYNNNINDDLFLNINFNANIKDVQTEFELMFENDKIKRIFLPPIINKGEDTVEILLKLKDLKYKSDEKKLSQIFNKKINVCFYDKESVDDSLPSFTIVFNKDKYVKCNDGTGDNISK